MGTLSIALFGIDGYSASSGDCAAVRPPRLLMESNPLVPSSRTPESTMPTTELPNASAALRNSGSTAGRWPFSVGPRCSCIPDRFRRRCTSGGATYTAPRSGTAPSIAWWTGSAPARSRIFGRKLCAFVGRWSTTKMVPGKSAGTSLISRRSASPPPADAPTTTISCPSSSRAPSVAIALLLPQRLRHEPIPHRPHRVDPAGLGRVGLDARPQPTHVLRDRCGADAVVDRPDVLHDLHAGEHLPRRGSQE